MKLSQATALLSRLNIRDRDSNDMVPFRLNPNQAILRNKLLRLEEQGKPLWFISLKARRVGVSSFTDGLMFAHALATPGMRDLILAHEKSSSEALFDVPLSLLASLPEMGIPRPTKTSITIPHNGNKSTLNIKTAGNFKAGRGFTLDACHLSECGFYSGNEGESFASLMNAVAYKEGSILCMESTANGMDGPGRPFYQFWTDSVAGKTDLEPIFLSWLDDPACVRDPREAPDAPADDDERELMEDYHASRGQIAWMRRTLTTKCNNDSLKFRREMPWAASVAFCATGDPAFLPDELRYARSLVCRPKYRGQIEMQGNRPVFLQADRGGLQVWEKPQPRAEYYVGCLPDGETVTTDSGPKRIEEVRPTDKLLDASGKFTAILRTMRREYCGEIHEIRAYGFPSAIRLTGEHPVLISDRATGDTHWVPARDVKPLDVICHPARMKCEATYADIESRWPITQGRRRNKVLPAGVMWDSRFWWLVGLFLADGWTRKDKIRYDVCFALNARSSDDLEVAEELKSVLVNLFRRTPAIRRRGNCLEIKASVTQLCEFLDQFGTRSHNKHIPWWVHGLPMEYREALARGYWNGDGCLSSTGNKCAIVNFTSISFDLLDGIRRILNSVGFAPSFRVLRDAKTTTWRGKIYNTKKTWELRLSTAQSEKLMNAWGHGWKGHEPACDRPHIWVQGGRVFSVVRSVGIIPYKGYVNNFETESHTYCSGPMIVHNCDCAKGTDLGDYAAIVVWRADGEQVAAFEERLAPELVAKVLNALARWYNEAMLNIELTGGYGRHAQIELRDKYGYWNFYGWKGRDDKRKAMHRSTSIGWETTTVTRELMFASFRKAVRSRTVKIHQESLASQMEHVRMNDNTRWTVEVGHDDVLCAGQFGWIARDQWGSPEGIVGTGLNAILPDSPASGEGKNDPVSDYEAGSRRPIPKHLVEMEDAFTATSRRAAEHTRKIQNYSRNKRLQNRNRDLMI